MKERKIRTYEMWQTPGGKRGSVVVDSPDIEIVIPFDDETSLRRSTSLSRIEAIAIAEAVAAHMAVEGSADGRSQAA